MLYFEVIEMLPGRAIGVAAACALLSVISLPASGQSLTVGDEVVFSGGPAQPPKSVNTGFSIEVKNVRGGPGAPAGGDPATGGPATGGPGQTAPVRGGAGAGASGSPCPPLGPGMAAPEETEPPVPPLRPRDLAGLPMPRLEEFLLSAAAPDDRFSAARALGKAAPAHRARACQLLREALQDEDLRVVREAVNGLVRLGDRGAWPQLLELLNQSDPDLLETVVEAAGTLGDARALAPLRTFRDGSGGRLDAAAARSLKRLAARVKVR